MGGGSNAIGLFHPFLNDDVKIIGVEAGGSGIKTGKHAAPLSAGTPGVLHGNKTYIMEDKNGQIKNTHSISSSEVSNFETKQTPQGNNRDFTTNHLLYIPPDASFPAIISVIIS